MLRQQVTNLLENMIEEIFKTIGIENIPTKVYLHLLEGGPASAGTLARQMHMPRSSLYGYLGILVSKGFAKEEIRHEKKYWRAASPESIKVALGEEEERIKKVRNEFDSIISDLEKKEVSKFSAPSLIFFNGKEELKQMFLDIFLSENLKTVAFWPMQDFLDLLGEKFMEKLSRMRIQNKLDLRVVWPADKVVKISQLPTLAPGQKFLRKIRVSPKKISTAMGFWVYGNKVLFISSKKESFGFIVESQDLADMMTTQFELIWDNSKPIHKRNKK